jgi:hypothetical protein
MRAEKCVQTDYWGDTPIFNDLHFQQMFGCTKRVAEKLIEVCIRQKQDIVFYNLKGNKRIRAHIKVLAVLKTFPFAVSFKAFEDYFQMSDATVRRSFHAMCGAIMSDEELLGAFLPNQMTCADGATVVKNHKAKHHVDGLGGFSLDCCQFKWKNCPTAWKGQVQGGKGYPSIVLEAGTNHDLFFWHAAFVFPGKSFSS